MALSKRMKEAIELLKKEEFYLHELPNWSAWRSYNLNKHIRTDTMKALERRGIVKISTCSEKRFFKVATLLFPDYEEISASEYCIRCKESYYNRQERYICRKTGLIVVGIDGRATVNAMKCT